MAIDIGSAAIGRAATGGVNTWVNKTNPANATGTITKIEIWANTELSNCEVATFYEPGAADWLHTRDNEAIGTVIAGSKQTFDVNLTVQEGDYIGIYFSAGAIELDTSGYTAIWYADGDQIPCSDVSFGRANGQTMSVHGTDVVVHALISTSAITIGTIGNLSRGITEALTSTSNITSSITGRLTKIITLVSASAIATSITSTLSRGVTKALTSTSAITTSITSSLSRGITETLASTVSMTTSITATLGKGITGALTSTANITTSTLGRLSRISALTSTAIITTSITSSLSRGIKQVLNTTVNITTSTVSILSRGITEALTSTANIVISISGRLKYSFWEGIKKSVTYTEPSKPSPSFIKPTKSDVDYTEPKK